jgi:hypothetical protein
MTVNVTALHFIARCIGEDLILFKALPENTRFVVICQTQESKKLKAMADTCTI